MPPNDYALNEIQDMLTYARHALDILARHEPPQSAPSMEANLAMERALEIVGEAARRVTPEIHKMYPQIPWHRIVGMRNILAHDYGSIEPKIVWQTVRHDLPNLVQNLEAILAEGAERE